jgi:hypothetical protein
LIIFFYGGDFGNHLFKYAFIEKIKKKGEILVTDEPKISSVFNLPRSNTSIILDKKWKTLFLRLSKVLAQLRLISYVGQNYKTYNKKYLIPLPSLLYKKGLFYKIRFIEGHFQSEFFFDKSIKDELIVKKSILCKSEEFLGTIPKNYQKVFVHIRTYSKKGYDLENLLFGEYHFSLPISYYKHAIKIIQDRVENPFFIFLSDSPEVVNEHFGYLENKLTSYNEATIDFSIMTLCEHGIMSNSSFSWWGGFLMSSHGEVIAPKYWIGYRAKIFYHDGVEPTFAQSIYV